VPRTVGNRRKKKERKTPAKSGMGEDERGRASRDVPRGQSADLSSRNCISRVKEGEEGATTPTRFNRDNRKAKRAKSKGGLAARSPQGGLPVEKSAKERNSSR